MEVDRKVTEVRPLGTSFAIAQNVLVTAAHVVAEFETSASDGHVASDLRLFAVLATDEPMPGQADVWGGPLPIHQITLNPDHDLAVLTVATPTISGRVPQFGTVPLTVDPPDAGSLLRFVEYPLG